MLLFLVLGLLTARPASSQDAIFSQHFAVPMYLNPAFAGAGADSRLVFNYRNQPYPGFGTFSTMNFSYDTDVPLVGGGLGLVLTSDYRGGTIMNNTLSAVYAYHLQAAERLFINFGAQAGYYRKDLQWNKLEFPGPESPPEQTWNHAADFAAGILIYNDWLYGGVAAHHLSRPRESFLADIRLAIKYTAHIGFYLTPSDRRRANTLPVEYFLSPNIIVQNQGDFFRINYGMYAGVKNLMAGVWYRQDLYNSSAFIFLVGMAINDYRIGYSYDYSLSGYSGSLQGAHEISVALNINNPLRNLRDRIINCPSF